MKTATINTLAVIAGLALFAFAFSGVFVGRWSFPVIGVALYFPLGLLLGRAVREDRPHLSLMPAVGPTIFASWFFLGTLSEAGIVRALIWPVGLLLIGGLSWLGARLTTRR